MTSSGQWIWVFVGFLMHQASGGCLDELMAAPKSPNHYLSDAAKYLTGSDKDPVGTYQSYKRRTEVDDPQLPYPPQPPSISIPETLEAFWEAIGLEDEVFSEPLQHKWTTSDSTLWRRRFIAKSSVKGKSRTLWRRKANADTPAVSIAQTDSRETEIAVQRKGSRDWDFFVYDEEGKLSAKSVFATRTGKNVTGPAPLTCLTCHYNREGRTFGNLPLSYIEPEKIFGTN